MYDASRDFQEFYDNHVRLGGNLRGDLAAKRDLNLDRLRAGLEELGNERNRKYPGPADWKNQGGYAMHTLNQSDEYDIDVAIIFERADLPDDPLAARQRICQALCKKCTNFSKEPQARANAVTVWYQDGYHIDFAIYRRWQEFDGVSYVDRMEHASTEWKPRGPMQVNDWFVKTVADKSPKIENLPFTAPPKVAPGQMRRIVRYLKRFCRSRSSYSLPGGMITSTLVSECYVSDPDRDDVSLYKTLEAIKNRLAWNTRVFSPVDRSIELTGKSEHRNQVKRLKKELDKNFPRLGVLHTSDCTKDQARAAWDWIFNHEYWEPVEERYQKVAQKILKSASDSLASQYTLVISCKLTRGKGTLGYADYPNDGKPLPKGVGLRFSVASTSCPGPYETHWFAENEGDEAEEANQIKWDRYETRCETSTAYTGKQTMTCKLEKGGRVLVQKTFRVNIR